MNWCWWSSSYVALRVFKIVILIKFIFYSFLKSIDTARPSQWQLYRDFGVYETRIKATLLFRFYYEITRSITKIAIEILLGLKYFSVAVLQRKKKE